MSRRATFRDILGSQNRGGQTAPVLFWFGARFIAWPLTYCATRIGGTPNRVTSVRLALALAAFALILSSRANLYLAGLICAFFSIVLDNVDGQLARLLDRASYFGKYYDGVVDSVIECGLPIMMGLHFLFADGDDAALLYGLIAGAAHGFVQLVMVRYGLMTEKYRSDGAPEPYPHPSLDRVFGLKAWSGLSWLFERYLPNLLWDIRFGGLALAILFALDREYLAVLAAFEMVLLVGFTFFRLIRAYLELDAHRFSSTHAARRTD